MASSYIEGNLYYTYLFDQKDKYDRYSCAVALEGDQVKKAKSLNLTVKQDDSKYNGMAYVQLKSNYQPDLYNKDGSEYDGPKAFARVLLELLSLVSAPTITSMAAVLPPLSKVLSSQTLWNTSLTMLRLTMTKALTTSLMPKK